MGKTKVKIETGLKSRIQKDITGGYLQLIQICSKWLRTFSGTDLNQINNTYIIVVHFASR